jgi:hypothetical protein
MCDLEDGLEFLFPSAGILDHVYLLNLVQMTTRASSARTPSDSRANNLDEQKQG